MESSDGQTVENVLATTLQTIRNFHAQGEYYDVQIQVGDGVFKTQRSLLAAISEYFHAMFSNNLKEFNHSKQEPIILHDIDEKTFEEILHFLYTGEVRVSDSNVYDLLFLSDYLGLRVPYVEQQCVIYIQSLCQKTRTVSLMPNALDLYSYACLTKKKLVVDIVTAYLCQHWLHYSTNEKFMEISFESLDALMIYRKNYILPLSGVEDDALKLISKWIRHSHGERNKYRSDLLKIINFSIVSSKLVLSLLNRLESVAATLVSYCDTHRTARLKKLSELEIESDDGDSRSEGLITFKKENVSEMVAGKCYYSTPCIISNISWKLMARRRVDGSFGLFIKCDGPSETSSWSCWASVELMLRAQKEKVKTLVAETGHIRFYSKMPGKWGREISYWNDIIDQEKGFVKNNSFIFQARIKADIPCVA